MILLLTACVQKVPPAPDDAPDSAVGDDTSAASSAGPCAQYGDPVAFGPVADGGLDELSGLVASRQSPDVLWAHEDSGGEPVLYALSTDGTTLGELRLDGVENSDWEDLALARCGAAWCLYVGDIGNNGRNRDTLAIHVVQEPSLDGWDGASTVTPFTRTFRYPEGAEDAEALAVTADGTALVLSKRDDGTSTVYRLPEGAETLVAIGTVVTGAADDGLAAQVTGADLWEDERGSTLLVRTYFRLYEVALNDGVVGAPRTLVPVLEPQGESVAWDPSGGFWQVSEWENPTLWRVGCADAR